MTLLNPLRRFFRLEIAVGDKRTVEGFAHFLHDPVAAFVLAVAGVRIGADDMEIGEAAPCQRFRRCRIGFARVRVFRAARPALRRKADAHAVCRQDLAHRIDDLAHQAQAIVETAAIVVGPVVGGRADELVDQVIVRAMHLHPVETRIGGAFRGVAKIVDQTRYLIGPQGAGFLERYLRPVLVPVADERLAVGCPGTGGHRLAAIGLEHRMADRADMPELAKDAPTGIVNRIGHRFPAFDLVFGKDAGGPGIALPLLADLGRFADDQACTRPLRIIERMQSGLLVRFRFGAAAGERGHEDAVGRFESADGHGVEQGGIGWHDISDKAFPD